MSDYISNADEIELLSVVLSDFHLQQHDSDMALFQGSSRSTSKSSSAHETSTDYDTGEQDDVYNNRPANYYYGDRSKDSPLWNTVNCSGSACVKRLTENSEQKWDHGFRLE